MRMYYFAKQSDVCSIMSEQPIELFLVKIELLREDVSELRKSD